MPYSVIADYAEYAAMKGISFEAAWEVDYTKVIFSIRGIA